MNTPPVQWMIVAFCLLAMSLVGTAEPWECQGLYGIHDHNPHPGEYLDHLEAGAGCGWVTATVAIGHDPNDTSSEDFSALANAGHTVICRLNHGYFPSGTIPATADYDDFAQRCAHFVSHANGCRLWVIGNELNIAGEWPVEGGRHAFVTPEQYADCFRRVYQAIKAVRPDHKVIPVALAPWSGPFGSGSLNGTPHDANPINWVQYLNRMLSAIEASGPVDGIALHINSRGYAYDDVHSPQRVNANGQSLSFSFYVYKDWIEYGIPASLWHLPLYATECNGYYFWKGGHAENPAEHYESGWIQEIYAEINRHNQSTLTNGYPVFRCVNLYRWCGACDGWNIDGANPYKAQILADLDAAVAHNYTWPGSLSRMLLVPRGAAWKFHDHGANLGTAWRSIGYDDGLWSDGPAQLGFGDGDEATVINSGPDGARHITTYFRREFFVDEPETFLDLLLRLQRDDGAVVYLNGIEIFRSNMPAGGIDYRIPANSALSGTAEDQFFNVLLLGSLYNPGTNLLAVEVHQANSTSSDLSFDLELFGVFNVAPAVALAHPVDGMVLAAGGPIRVQAGAMDADGLVSRVEFFAGHSLLGVATNSPFQIDWRDTAAGVQTLKAVALDNAGRRATSAPVHVVLQPGLVVRGANWKYHDLGVNLGTSWRAVEYNDAGWSSGPAQLGFGDGDEATVVNGGPSGNRFMTLYFRHSFMVENPLSYTNLLVRLLRDDGAVAYLNGHEILRSNMPESGPIAYATPALDTVGGDDEDAFYSATVSSALLQPGDNVLAIEIHQANSGSSDLSMDLELIGLGAVDSPQLVIWRTGNTVFLSWPRSFSSHVLETSESTAAGSIWTQYEGLVRTVGGLHLVIVPVTPQQRFFRLRWP